MPLIQTAELRPESLDPETTHQVYCALDSMLTLEILQEVQKQHPGPNPIYRFEKALQAPLLEMSLRGFRIDLVGRHRLELELRAKIAEGQLILDEMAQAAWAKPLNPRSPHQLQEFFYGTLGIPPVILSFKGEKRVSTNREALEKIEEYLYARPFVSMILHLRDLGKQLSVIVEEIDPDGRHRTSYNIGGTETGRLSSSTSVLGTGGNAQNIAPELRRVFVSDPGYLLCSIDLEQVEARDVGFLLGVLFGDWTLLDSAEGADLHTSNCMLCWPEHPWTPGDMAANRRLAESIPLYRDWSLRDGAKRMGHLTNYRGTAWMITRVLKIPQAVAEEFQARYCLGGYFHFLSNGQKILHPTEELDPDYLARHRVRSLRTEKITPAYPSLQLYWQWCAERLQKGEAITTPFGRQRHFFGDPRSDTTLREAIAFVPQSMTADRTNLWLWKVWARLGTRVQLLAQTHDSITFQFPETEDVDDIIHRILDLLSTITLSHDSRVYRAPGEAKLGWNWASVWTEEDNARLRKDGKEPKALNPEGLKKWKLGVPDTRVRSTGKERL